jgi:hypothetical protein
MVRNTGGSRFVCGVLDTTQCTHYSALCLYATQGWLKYAGGMREKMTETVTIRLTPSAKEALQALADADKRKLASYLTLVLEEHAERAEKPKRGAK